MHTRTVSTPRTLLIPASRRRLLRATIAAAAGAAVAPRAVRSVPPAHASSRSLRTARLVQSLSLEQRVGQLFMVGLQSDATEAQAEQTNAAIRDLHAGNVVLYGAGWDSATKVRAATRPLQSLAREANGGVGLFISGNQEGGQWGSFQAFYGPGFSPMPSPISRAQGDPALLEEQARIWGGQLLSAGVNLNLAPVLDTVPRANAAANEPIGFWGRQYGFEPDHVTTYGVAFARGMRAAEVAVSIKHFPGLGRVTGNTDFTAEGIVDQQFSGPDDPYIAPFKAGIDAGAEFVMMALARYPNVDSLQAVFSPIVMRDILRDTLGFEGIIITDDVGAAAAVADRTPAQRALDFFSAGGDMLLTILPGDIAPMRSAVLTRMAADTAFRDQIGSSVARVLRVKEQFGLLPGMPATATSFSTALARIRGGLRALNDRR